MSFRCCKLFRILLPVFASTAIASVALAENVYKSTDSAGRTVYTTKPSGVPAQLPTLQRESSSKRVQAALVSQNLTCDKHGGIDCTKGADTDESVVCMDGSKGSKEQFLKFCEKVRLRAEPPHYLDNTGKEIADIRAGFEQIETLSLVIRNLSPIAANDVSVLFPLSPVRERLPASGPLTIEPYGIGEYTVALGEAKRRFNRYNLRAVKLLVDCENCETVLGPVK